MKIKDKKIKEMVDVAQKECPRYACYWPRPDPGSFTVGVGYRRRDGGWLCGTRELKGCPEAPVVKTQAGK